MNDSVINALSAALEATPDDDALRAHLASVLLDAGRLEDAAPHFQAILAKDPADLPALRGAAQCARAMGEDQRAASYERLLAALGDAPVEPEAPAPASSNVVQAFPGGDRTADDTADIPNIEVNEEAQETPARARLSVVDSDNVAIGPWEDTGPRVTLDDVGGMHDVKERLNLAFLAPLKNPEIASMYGKSLKGGLMLYGPPGCGKTFIAKALAGELGARFMSVGLSDVLDMWLGESERKLHEIFETARRNAPTVVFFDEIDALGQKRSQQRHSAGRTIVNQLLSELDSVEDDNKQLFVLAATNHPWDVDAALRRPGRFDRTVLVLPPDEPARASILEYHLREKPVQDLDLAAIAGATSLFSGADLAHICDSATESAMHDSLRTGTARPLQQQDFERALKEVRPSTRPWFETARNYAMFANEGGSYDDLLAFIRANKL